MTGKSTSDRDQIPKWAIICSACGEPHHYDTRGTQCNACGAFLPDATEEQHEAFTEWYVERCEAYERGDLELRTDGGTSDRYPHECEGCGVEGPGPIGSGVGGEPLRAIKMKTGGREMLCVECFVKAVEDGRIDESDPRVEPSRLVTGTPGAPGQDADPDGWIHRPDGGTADNESTVSSREADR